MKKRLLSAAILLAFGGAAQAQVSIYGLVDMSYGKSFVSDLIGDKAQFHSGGDNGSSEGNSTTRVGIKGGYDLGGGVKANFRFETSGIQSDGDKNGALFGRQAWFGLSGGFGEFRIGRQDSVPFQTMIDFDFNGASNGVSAGAYGGVGVFNRGRQSGALNYIAPSMNGFTAQIGYQPKGNAGTDKDIVSFGLKYAAGPLAAGVSFQSKPDSASKDFSSIAASYDFGVAKVMAGYANGGSIPIAYANAAPGVPLTVVGNNVGKGYTLGVQAPIAGFTVGAIYADNNDSLAKTKSTEIFINREIYKNTYLYLEGGSWKGNVGDGEGGVVKKKLDGYALGLIFVF